MSTTPGLSPSALAWAEKHHVKAKDLVAAISVLRDAKKQAESATTFGVLEQKINATLEAAAEFAKHLPLLEHHPNFSPTDDRNLVGNLRRDLERLLDLAGMNPALNEVRRIVGEPERPRWKQSRPKHSMTPKGVFSRMMASALASEHRKLTGRRPTSWPDATKDHELVGELPAFIRAGAPDVGLTGRDIGRLAKRYTRSPKRAAK